MREPGWQKIGRPEGGDAPAEPDCLLASALRAMAQAENAARSGSAAGMFEAAGHLESTVEACRQYGESAQAAGTRKPDRESLTAIRSSLQRIGSLMAQSAEFQIGRAHV